MKYKICTIRLNVTKYEVTFAQGREFNPTTPCGYAIGDDCTIQ